MNFNFDFSVFETKLKDSIWIYSFHKTSIKNRNYRGTIKSSIINEIISPHFIDHHSDDKFKDKPKKRGIEKNKNNSTSDIGNMHY